MKSKFEIFNLLVFFLCLNCNHLSGNNESSEDAFSKIYKNKEWGQNEDGSPSSGYGSKYEYNIPYIDFLVNFLHDFNIQSVVDVGCGDWEFSKHIHWNNVNYIGIDVVKSVIERNKQLYSSPNISFLHFDILSPQWDRLGITADLLICKDVLQHLTFNDISVFLSKISTFKYCLITNDFEMGPFGVGDENVDISHKGPNRPIDLAKPPFNVKGETIFLYKIGNDTKGVFLIENLSN